MPDPVDNKIIESGDDISSPDSTVDVEKIHQQLDDADALEILGNQPDQSEKEELPSVDLFDSVSFDSAASENVIEPVQDRNGQVTTLESPNNNQLRDSSRSEQGPDSLFLLAQQEWQNPGNPSEAIAWQTGQTVSERALADTTESEEGESRNPESDHKPLSEKELEAMAEAIDNAANGGLFGAGTDIEGINEQLKRLRTPKERELLDKLYRDKTGHGIEDELKDEMSGSDLAKSLELWKAANVDAARIHVGLIEHKESGIGARSDEIIEKDLRDTVSTMNSEQIKELDEYYQKHHGTSVHDVLLNDDNLPQATKDALKIYLKGNDKRTVQDTLDLADIALKDGNLEMFQEAMRDATPEARKAFLENDGESKVLKAFGDGEETEDTRHALDYVNQGKLDLATKIEDNTGTFNDNEDAIENAIKSMTDAERQSYQKGKDLTQRDVSSLSDTEKADRAYYERVNKALESAGNDREVAKWEDLITNSDGSLVSKLAEHGGFIDDGMDDVLKTIEDMSEEDWKRLKEDPEYRKQVEKVLDQDLSNSEMKRAKELLDEKINAESFDDSKTVQRDVLAALGDESGFWNTDEEGVLDRLSNMTEEEKERYRTDEEFREEVDQKVRDIMDEGFEQKSAFSLLDSIKNGEDPDHNIVSKLYNHANHFNTSEVDVVKDLEQALRDDPKLLERLRNDQEFREEFDRAAHEALDPDEYNKYVKPIIEDGRLSFKVKAELYNGFFNDDEAGVFDALQSENGGTEDDWREIIASPEDTLPFMSEAEREVALNIALQKGEMRPEDKLRAAMLGAGTETTTIQQVLDEFTPEQLASAKLNYLNKYDSDLMGDLFEETGGRDRAKIVADIRDEPQSDREAFNNARDAVYESVDGVGRDFVDAIDGTGDMTLDTLNQYARKVSDYSSKYEEMPAEERRQIEEQLEDAAEMYRESKNSAADMAVDGVIIAAGIAAAKFTGGVSLSLLAYTSVGGALFKVGAKSAIMGADYDLASADTATDALTGGVDAATMFLGPAQAAQMLRLGEKSAARAATAVLTHSDDIARAGGKQLIKEGTEQQLEKKMFEHVAFAISNGSDSVDDKAIANIAKEFASSADEVPQLQQVIKQSLNEAVQAEASNATKATMRELALNSAAGNVGGGLSGGVYGLAEWDTTRSLDENLAIVANSAGMGSMMGTGMAGGFTLGFKGLGKSVSALRRGGPDAPGGAAADNLISSVDDISRADVGDADIGPAVGRAPEVNVDENAIDFSPEVKVSVSDDMSAVRTSALAEVGAGNNHIDISPGDKIKFDGQEAQFVKVDETSGFAIVRFPERAHYAVQSRPANDMSPYRQIEIDGKNYYANEHGSVYSLVEIPGNEPMLMPKHEYTISQAGSVIEPVSPGKAPFSLDQRVQTDDGLGYVAGFDGETGDVIVRYEGRESFVSQLATVDNLNGYRHMEINGESYFRDGNGMLWSGNQLPDGRYVLAQSHEYAVRPRTRVSEVEISDTGNKVHLDSEAELDNPKLKSEKSHLTPDAERAEVPRLPKREGFLSPGERVYQNTDIYDNARLTLNGQQVGDLSYDGPPIELGRKSLGIEFKDSGELVSSKHASVKWDPEEQMFFMEEHSLNGTYVKRAGGDEFQHYTGGKETPYRVYLGPNDVVRLGSLDGPELKLNVPDGGNLKPQPGPGGNTDVRVFFDGQPLKFGDDGEIMVGRDFQQFGNNSPGDILNRRVSSNHAKLKWNESEQGWELTDLTGAPGVNGQRTLGTVVVRRGGNGTFVKRADGEVDLIQGKSTILREGDKIHLGSPDGPELKFVSYEGVESIDGRVKFDRGVAEGAIKRPDGTTSITDRFNFRRLEDPNGRVIQTLDSGGASRRFKYSDSGDLAEIRFNDGSVASRSSGDNWVIKSSDGTEKKFWKGPIDIESDGSIKFTDQGNPPRQTIERVDGTREVIHPNGRVDYQNIDFMNELGYMNRISQSFDNPQQGRRFKELMSSFERRAREVGLSADEKGRTFHQVRRLMTAEEGAFLTPKERSQLAEQIFNQASNPSLVSQGYNNTCNVATVEHRMFARKPSEAARLIADVVITGKYVTADGTTVDLARIPGVLQPDSEARRLASEFSPAGDDLRIDGKRTYASQIFETTAVNLKYARSEEFKVKSGELVVYEKPPTPVTSKGTGEELAKYSVDSDGLIKREVVKTSPHITTAELVDIYNQIADTAESNFAIRHSSRSGPRGDNSYGVRSASDLQKAIEQLDQQGGKPGILQVHTGNEPFWADSGGGRAGGSGGWHVVNVHGIRRDARTGQLVVDVTNQWGDSVNHMGDKAIPLEQLYKSTMEPPKVEVKPAKQEQKKGFFRNLFGSNDDVSSGGAYDRQVVANNAVESAIDDIGDQLDSMGSGKRGRGRKMWHPARDIQKMDADERSNMLVNIEQVRSQLNNDQAAESFINEILPGIKNWEDLSLHELVMREANDDYHVKVADYQALLDFSPDLPLRAHTDTKLVRAHFEGDPEKLAIVDDYVRARDARYEAKVELDARLEGRKNELQDAVNRFAHEKGIPPIEIEYRDDDFMGGARAKYGDGVITLSQGDLVNNDNAARLIGSTFHEFTHADQHNTILRALADEISVPRSFGDADIDALAQLYYDRTGRNVGREYLESVLSTRSQLDSMELPFEDQLRVPALVDAMKNNSPAGDLFKQTGDDFRVTNSALKRMNSKDPNAVIKILEKMHAKNGTGTKYNQHIFGLDNPPSELSTFYEAYRQFNRGDYDAWTPEVANQAREQMRIILQDRLEDINTLRRDAYNRYMQLHEQDAFVSGERARIAARNRGASEGPASNEVDGITWLNDSDHLENIRFE